MGSKHGDIRSLSCAMDKISDPLITSRAYQRLVVALLTTAPKISKGEKGDRKATLTSMSGVVVSGTPKSLHDVRKSANRHQDLSLALQTYERSNDILPKEYLQVTGLSVETTELLHPDIKLPETTSQLEQVMEGMVSMLFTRSCLSHGNEVAACEILQKSRLHGKAVQDLWRYMDSTREYERRVASEILKTQTRLSENAVGSLLTCLQNRDASVRRRAVEALRAQSQLPETAIHSLVACLENKDSAVR